MAAALSGKQVLVTGASAGIGRACAVALARAGAKVIATGRRAAELESLGKEIPVQTLAGDLNDAGFAEDLAAAAREADLFVNNAGILKYAPFLEMTDEDCEAMFRTNVLAAFRISRLVARSMVRRGHGHIIVMTSIAAREVYQLGLIYCATKHALSAMARGLRIELQSQGIRVTEVAPGMVQAHVIRLLAPCDPKVVSKWHYHDVNLQFIYVLNGWSKNEFEGQGVHTMHKGACWLQPPKIRHRVLDYSPDCELLEVVLPADFDTVEFE